MKKLFPLLMVGFFLLCIPSMAAAIVGTNTGTWDMTSGIENGTWTETYGSGGPGSPGGDLSADGVTGQWSLYDATSGQAVPSTLSGWDYETPYTGTFDLSFDGDGSKWGGGVSGLSVTGTNYSNSGSLEFMFVAEGIHDGLYKYEFTAMFDSSFEDTEYNVWGDGLGHDGDGFKSIDLEISQVPIPGALWLLGSGLVGLVGIRRKINK